MSMEMMTMPHVTAYVTFVAIDAQERAALDGLLRKFLGAFE